MVIVITSSNTRNHKHLNFTLKLTIISITNLPLFTNNLFALRTSQILCVLSSRLKQTDTIKFICLKGKSIRTRWKINIHTKFTPTNFNMIHIESHFLLTQLLCVSVCILWHMEVHTIIFLMKIHNRHTHTRIDTEKSWTKSQKSKYV